MMIVKSEGRRWCCGQCGHDAPTHRMWVMLTDDDDDDDDGFDGLYRARAPTMASPVRPTARHTGPSPVTSHRSVFPAGSASRTTTTTSTSSSRTTSTARTRSPLRPTGRESDAPLPDLGASTTESLRASSGPTRTEGDVGALAASLLRPRPSAVATEADAASSTATTRATEEAPDTHSIRDHPAVRDAIAAVGLRLRWHTDERLSESEYRRFHRALTAVLDPTLVDEDEWRASVTQDWHIDSTRESAPLAAPRGLRRAATMSRSEPTATVLTYPQFHDALFEAATLWAPGPTLEDHVLFLSLLGENIARVLG